MSLQDRLGVFVVPPESDADKLRRLAAALDAGRELRADDRRDAASYLRRLAESDKAMAALTRRRGRPRNSMRARNIALHYLVQRELLGRGRAALMDVAIAWCDGKDTTVKDAWTDWQTYAKWQLAELERTAQRMRPGPRKQLLQDISADLRERSANGRRK